MDTLKATLAGVVVGVALGLSVPPEHPEPTPANNDYYMQAFDKACKGQLEEDLSCSTPGAPSWDITYGPNCSPCVNPRVRSE